MHEAFVEETQALTRELQGVLSQPIAGQIMSKTCNVSPETEFTHLILALKSECS